MRNSNHKANLNRLAHYRKARGLSQLDVTRILGLKSSAHISRWEHGYCWPSAVNMLTLAVLYKVPVDWLYADALSTITDELQEKSSTFP